MDQNKQASIIVGASEVAGDRRHLYLLFQKADGEQIVVRGGPDARTEGNDLANLAGSTILGSENFGHINVMVAPYVAPYEAFLQRQQDGSVVPVPVDQANQNDTALLRDARGELDKRVVTAPDWPAPGEHHERAVAWTGTDKELDEKLAAVLKAGDQINRAQLEYSPLYNNSNGVASTLMKAAGVQPVLPKDAKGEAVKAPNFGEDLYQDVGLGSYRSGYRFNGSQWLDADDQRIAPPTSGEPVKRLDPDAPSRGSSDGFKLSMSPDQPQDPMFGQIRDGVNRIDGSLGRTPDASSERMTWSLYALAKEQGLREVDDVRLGQAGTRAGAGEYVFLVQGDPSTSVYRREQMKTDDAIKTPVEQSFARAQTAEQTKTVALDLDVQEQNVMQTAPNLRV
jgi:hypothetical protein